ncbi:MAG: permease [Alphaproteobacteria bacterium]
MLAPAQVPENLKFVTLALLQISPLLMLSVAIAAAAQATGSEKLIAQVFTGNPLRMITAAALFGSLLPFCSCGVIPLVAGLLTAGVPLAPVMAFWLSSPLMDPEMFILIAATLGLHFIVGKTLAAFGMGLLGGFSTLGTQRLGFFGSPLSEGITDSCGKTSGVPKTTGVEEETAVLWPFWREPERRRQFTGVFLETDWFLGKWLTLDFIIEGLMVAYIPASIIAQGLGGGNWWTIPAAVLVGLPAYLNGFAAIPPMEGLIDLGMAKGAAMAFMVAGGVTCIPAAVGVFALVRRPVFAWYGALALISSLVAGFA